MGLEGNNRCDNRRWQRYVWPFTALFITRHCAAEFFHADEGSYGYCDFNRELNLIQRIEPQLVPIPLKQFETVYDDGVYYTAVRRLNKMRC
jgi:hypothetical protein